MAKKQSFKKELVTYKHKFSKAELQELANVHTQILVQMNEENAFFAGLNGKHKAKIKQLESDLSLSLKKHQDGFEWIEIEAEVRDYPEDGVRRWFDENQNIVKEEKLKTGDQISLS